MSGPSYRTVFEEAFYREKRLPYTYQCRLACGPAAEPEHEQTLRNGTTCESQLIEIPTGLGKTAAVVLAWLWNRVVLPPLSSQPSTLNLPRWPRRLVYCLPMRTLVEQTAGEVERWIGNLHASAEKGDLVLSEEAKARLEWLAEHSPIILMGGAERDGDWDTHPER